MVMHRELFIPHSWEYSMGCGYTTVVDDISFIIHKFPSEDVGLWDEPIIPLRPRYGTSVVVP